MIRATDTHDRSPRVKMRLARHGPEAYLPGTGLTVWEIAWVARLYNRDIDATMAHLGQSRDVIEAGLRYADEHAAEIEAEIKDHTADSPEELQEKLPGVGMTMIDVTPSDEQLQ